MKISSICPVNFKGVKVYEDGMSRNALRASHMYAGSICSANEVRQLDMVGIDVFLMANGDSKNSFYIGYIPKKFGTKDNTFFYKAYGSQIVNKQTFSKKRGKDGKYFYHIDKNVINSDNRKTLVKRREWEENNELASKLLRHGQSSYWKTYEDPNEYDELSCFLSVFGRK